MIWSLVRILVFVAITAALAYAGGLLIESDGSFRLTAFGVEATLGPLDAVIAAALLVLAIWILIKVSGLLVAVYRFINGDETAISRYFDRSRERRGFEALADGMMALAAGEGRLAMAKAARAEKYLARPALTNLLAAQAAELAGDSGKAEEVYKRLLQDERTRFVGVRGLMKQRLSEGDTDTALQLAERAFALKPRHDETADVLLRLQADKGDWGGARRTLGAKLRSGALPRDVHRRRDAVLALSEAAKYAAEGNDAAHQEKAIEAVRLSPDLVPAAAAAARAYIAQGRPNQAAKVIKKAWASHPHPDLAAAFADIAPEESAEERVARFGALTRIDPEHEETRLIMAELSIAAEDYPAARQALGTLAETHPTARTLALMAATERGEGSEDRIVRAYLSKAVQAPRGPAWVCDNCQSVEGAFTPVCSNCKGFDTLSWREPAATGPANSGVELLPLLMEDGQSAPGPAESEVVESAAPPPEADPPEEVRDVERA